jgi:hypothetical protein
MKHLLKVLVVGLLVLTSCNKDEVAQPNLEIFYLEDLSGEWFASENTINNKRFYNVSNIGDSVIIDSFNHIDYYINLVDSRTIYIEDNNDVEKYIFLRR